MIDEPTLQAAIPFVAALSRGENPSFPLQEEVVAPYAIQYGGDDRRFDYDNAPEGSIAVHEVQGMILKHDGPCSIGTETMMDRMRAADRHSSIQSHFIKIDSGGGQGTNIETMARVIRHELKKPVVAWFNGTCASAAFYIAAAADKVYASEGTDIVGSIGVLANFNDVRAHLEQNGIVIHEVYADQSELKNKEIADVFKGDYDAIKANILNPYAQQFIDTVKEFRPQLTEEDAFKGKVFMTKDAIKIGMIDGQKTFEEAINSTIELSQKSNTNTMSFPRLEAIIGYDIEVHNGGAFLRSDALQLLERNIVAEGFEAVDTSQLESLTDAVTGLSEKLGTVQGDITAIRADITANSAAIQEANQEIKVLGDQPGAVTTNVATDKDPGEGLEVDAIAELANEARSNGRVDVIG